MFGHCSIRKTAKYAYIMTSSPGFPRLNGKAESAVKAAKTMMMKLKDAKTDPYIH